MIRQLKQQPAREVVTMIQYTDQPKVAEQYYSSETLAMESVGPTGYTFSNTLNSLENQMTEIQDLKDLQDD